MSADALEEWVEVSVDPHVKMELEEIARRRGVALDVIVREALATFIAAQRREQAC